MISDGPRWPATARLKERTGAEVCAFDDRELVQQEVGQIAVVGLGVHVGARVLGGGLLEDAGDRQVLGEPVPLGAHRPVEERSRRASVAVRERMVMAEPEVQGDRPHDRVDELVAVVLCVGEVAERTQPCRQFAGGRRSVEELAGGPVEDGDPLVAGAAWGRVRALINDKGEQVKSVGPSTPVEVLGLSDVAQAGDSFVVAPDERKAAKVAETREHWQRVASHGRDAHAMSGGARLEDIFSQIQAGEAANLNLIIKADVNGALEALTESLKKLERPEVKLSFVHRGVGGITQGDIELAAASNATIIGFNVRPDRKIRELAENESVEIRTYEIIYKAIEDIENAMVGMLEPEYEEVVTGEAEVREVIRVPRVGAIAGCYVTNGVITRGSKVRFLREGTIIWKGAIASLRRFKDDVREVKAGFECGIGLTDFQDLKPGDIIETYEEREIPRT